ncbi:hypothetical protein SERLADRAFT_402088 [Serpula lacrymans var. lacrymans S7.9]|nr:uncharacterized protein SERLADRAFT_402088 [Serpula lacrymans var. lacrymans S7.9]EGO19593.1 hypothetical protein SERLADRAFT_402088 [Serpula lacrymans var. lacrymans S7.9]
MPPPDRKEDFAMPTNLNTAQSNSINDPLTHTILRSPLQSSSRSSIAAPSYRSEPSSSAESNALNASLIRPSNYPLLQASPRSSSEVQLSRTGNQVWHESITDTCPPSYISSQPSLLPSSVVPSIRTADSDMHISTTGSDLPAYSRVAAESRQSLAAPSYSSRPGSS